MMDALAQRADARVTTEPYETLRVSVLTYHWNTHAIDFYKKSGAHVLDDWNTVQMDENAIASYVKSSH